MGELLTSKPPRTLIQLDNVYYPENCEHVQVKSNQSNEKCQLSNDTSENRPQII